MPVVLQIITFVVVSLFTGIAFTKLGFNFFLGFSAGIAVQFIGNYIFTTFFNLYAELKNKKLENERIKEFSYQGLEVECPCYKKNKEFVPVRLNSENKYKCNECNKSISILIEASTALATEPIYSKDNTLNATLATIANSTDDT